MRSAGSSGSPLEPEDQDEYVALGGGELILLSRGAPIVRRALSSAARLGRLLAFVVHLVDGEVVRELAKVQDGERFRLHLARHEVARAGVLGVRGDGEDLLRVFVALDEVAGDLSYVWRVE
eukprot:CAMPEP_0113274458 /NCGR_PEP_ID=MMETSP0008_2-20120614/24415_1 /TAXON_ID=97485 /ORGANISM="Prymnesium parvum" /LENGTH=120 /DNA_ID=CAMNT_0000124083 /DNA_START=169 /DNA_END=530 /DNA_ORIENTATION=+ /assembly_acc=CAM_ASM_000153